MKILLNDLGSNAEQNVYDFYFYVLYTQSSATSSILVDPFTKNPTRLASSMHLPSIRGIELFKNHCIVEPWVINYYKRIFLPEDDDILRQGKEDKDDACTHPDVQSRDIAHLWRTLPKIIIHEKFSNI